MYKCPNCGGEIAFLPDSGMIRCEFCGSEFSPESVKEQKLDGTRKTAEEHTLDGVKLYVCSQCGATIYTTEETGVTFCSYCGSQAFLESRMKGTEGVLPDLIIPFQISKEQCEKIYKEKIKSAWFLPSSMKSDDTIDKFRGIYMPCWVYAGEADADGEYTSIITTRQGAFDIIDTYRVTADVSGTYSGFIEDASSSFPDGIMEEIAPFSLKSAREFNDKYMAGYYADIGNVPPEVYYEEVSGAMDASIKNDLYQNKEIRSNRVSSGEIDKRTSVSSHITHVRKGFLPVWFLSNKNERTGLMSYAVVNGLSGKIHADLPIDMKKYLLVALAAAVPIFVILQFFTMKPTFLLLITMLLLFIMMFFSTRMLKERYIQEHGLDDEGLLYLNKGKNKKQAESREQDGSYHSAAKKSSTPPGNIGLKVRKVFLGILCFLVIPLATLVFYAATDVNLIVFGFIAGIVLYIIFGTGKPLNSTSSTSQHTPYAEFAPPGKKIRLPFFVFLRAVMFPLIGILVGVLILLTQPVHDLYYYGAAMLCCIMLILTVLDFVRATNRLALRKPAQLGKRGGDEDE